MMKLPLGRGNGQSLVLDNIADGETVYQRCVLIRGSHPEDASWNGSLIVTTRDPAGAEVFPEQVWPMCQGQFKVMVFLNPGENLITLRLQADFTDGATIKLVYTPLLQQPPLHLAIMIAKDSPMLIDCPPGKGFDISSAHNDLQAAIAKFRMTAYMWQALTAEDMRAKGLGRASFRLEEEWGIDTISQKFLHNSATGFLLGPACAMRSTAKVHLVQSSKTVAELQDKEIAQQNQNARQPNELFDIFKASLKAKGAPFRPAMRPVVAGLILDSHYSVEQNLIVGHAALGCHDPNGLSLGIFGSHLAYSLPRFVEEIPACLLDINAPGESVGNDCNECGTFWEACSINQGAFLHEVGHALGAPHTTGIMARGYAQDWPKAFMPVTAYCSHTKAQACVVDSNTRNNATWDLQDALSFRALPHFRCPTDRSIPPEELDAQPSVEARHSDEKFNGLLVSCRAGIVQVTFNDVVQSTPTVSQPGWNLTYAKEAFEQQFSKSTPVKMGILGFNGKKIVIPNVWKLLNDQSSVAIPGTSVVLRRRMLSSKSSLRFRDAGAKSWTWNVLLTRRNTQGYVIPAASIDICVGCYIDGAVVRYRDGSTNPCGPRWTVQGHDHEFGGHATQTMDLPLRADIVKVDINNNGDEFQGLRLTLSDGSARGELNTDPQHATSLVPPPGEKIVGFCGSNAWGRGCEHVEEFGIITAPRDFVLPAAAYDLPELQNIDGGNGPRPSR